MYVSMRNASEDWRYFEQVRENRERCPPTLLLRLRLSRVVRNSFRWTLSSRGDTASSSQPNISKLESLAQDL